MNLPARIEIPKRLFKRNPLVSTLRLLLAVALVSIGEYLTFYSGIAAFNILGILVVGAMFAHLTEIQHECLHHHTFNNKSLNRITGVLVGMPMLNNYSHYRARHLHHHATLGTPKNNEFFHYSIENMTNPTQFLRAMLSLSRFKSVAYNIFAACCGKDLLDGRNKREKHAIQTEYRLFGLVILSVLVGLFSGLHKQILFGWVLPLICVAEPIHFLIELPEHFGLEAWSCPDVFRNTRTITGSLFSFWFTNGNNLHTAHHYSPGVPMIHTRSIQRLIAPYCEVVHDNYWSFFAQLLRRPATTEYNQEEETKRAANGI